jgi:hypothetical protein
MTKMDKNDSILACVELLKIGQFQSIFKAFKDTAYYSRSGLVHRAKDFKHLESHVAGLRRLKEPSDDQKAFLAIFTKDFEPKFRWALKHSHSTLHDLVHRRNSLAHPTTVSPERLAYLISVLEHPHLRNLSKEFIPFVTGNIVLNPIDNDNENEFDDN